MSDPAGQEVELPSRSRVRGRLIWAALLVLVVAALAVLPPLINGERYRRRITTAMSQSLGRPVHVDKVTFHLLPMPGITLGNLVVDENPAFGSEPVIRANAVEATLRLSSLWRRQFEIATLRFVTDENGAGASVNIVRNAEGRWNLQDILTQAAKVNAAPTAQRKAGPEPRFPYIEATGARVNLKLGEEKMPFSLTDADFALWQPSAQVWEIRLKGKPARTDANTQDTGTMSLEGTLGRAATLAEVPIHLEANWAHAPMGEATRVMTGEDQLWRGTLEAGATLTGTVGAAELAANVHVTDLRRADFYPAELLDVSAHCEAKAELTGVLLTEATCSVPNGGPKPMTVESTAFDLQHPRDSAVTMRVEQVPLNWTLLWARLFTQRIPADLRLTGTVDGTLAHVGAGDWSGLLLGTLDGVEENGKTTDFSAKPVEFAWKAGSSAAGRPMLQLQPVAVRLGGASELMLGAEVDPGQYSFQLTGSATAAQVKGLGDRVMPPLGEELAGVLKTPSATAEMPVDVTCVRPFAGVQRCVAEKPAAVVKKKGRRRVRG